MPAERRELVLFVPDFRKGAGPMLVCQGGVFYVNAAFGANLFCRPLAIQTSRYRPFFAFYLENTTINSTCRYVVGTTAL